MHGRVFPLKLSGAIRARHIGWFIFLSVIIFDTEMTHERVIWVINRFYKSTLHYSSTSRTYHIRCSVSAPDVTSFIQMQEAEILEAVLVAFSSLYAFCIVEVEAVDFD